MFTILLLMDHLLNTEYLKKILNDLGLTSSQISQNKLQEISTKYIFLDRTWPLFFQRLQKYKLMLRKKKLWAESSKQS